MNISSPAFADGKPIPKKYTSDGLNINPPIEINDVPEGGKTLALIIDTPDAPVGIFTHWLVWNIVPTTSFIEEGLPPRASVQGTNSFGKRRYSGPSPEESAKNHLYRFRLYAIDIKPDLNKNTERKALERAIEPHIIKKEILTGTYSRSEPVLQSSI